MQTIKTILFLFLASASLGFGQIYADFTTSMGSFTCALKYVESPQAVANFIGLAEGSRPWIDPATGVVRSGVPYYTGVTFHRVMAGFMNQSGSRNGLGSDGPGYTFRDEVTNGLTHSLTGGTLSMANSGLNTNGAQFFITAGAASFLDGGYTIFGSVTSGFDVIMAINAVPKTLNSGGEVAVPVTPVIIRNIAIRRVGVAANAFDINAQTLPICGGVAGSLKVTPGVSVDYVMSAPQPAATDIQVSLSSDLRVWTRINGIYQDPGSAGSSSINFTNSNIASRAFYNVSLVQNPAALGPASTSNRTLTAVFGAQSLTYHINAQGTGGTVDYNNSITISNYEFSVYQFNSGPYSGTWIFTSSSLKPIQINAAYDGSSSILIQGRMSLKSWDGAQWSSPTTGIMSLTK